MSQDASKPRKRDKFRAFLGIQPPSRSVSPNPPTPSPSGRENRDSSHPPKAARKIFRRSSSFEKDLVALSTTYLLQDNAKLRELIVLIVRVRDRDEDDKLVDILHNCGCFSADLAQLSTEDPETAASAIDEFLRTVRAVDSYDHDGEESALETLKLQATCSLSEPISRSKTRRGFSRTILAVVGSGFTILDILKDASEAIGVVPLLKPIFASVAILLRTVQQTQVNFNEMKDLALTAGDFALRLVETCSTLPVVPLEQSNNFSIKGIVVKLDQMALETLPKQGDISGIRAEYMDDSRKMDVEEICKHLFDAAELVVWIEGPAGVGKSTLVDHLSQQLRSAGLLAASLFLGAFPTDNVGPETIIKMLSHEVGKNHPRAILKIVEAMNKCNGLPLQDHVECYILEPLQSLAHPHPLIVIVDAVDEWKSHPSFIKTLAHLNLETSTVKFIITSRSKPRSSHLPDFDKISVHLYTLHPVPQEVVKTYLNHHFDSIDWDYGRKPSSYEVHRLAELSGGLLVWGATVCSLLSHKVSSFTPHELLSGILAEEHKVGSDEQLAQLYHNTIIRLFTTDEVREHLRRYLSATIVLQEALPVHDFSSLVGMPPYLITGIQSTLSALQTRSPPPGSDKAVVHPASTLFHLSFLEYVQTTRVQNAFTVSAFNSHSALGLACLEPITSLSPTNQISAFSLRSIQRYAVKYWPLHVSHGTHRSVDEWFQTPHCSTLQTIPVDAQQRWAALFLNMWLPETEVVVMEEQDMTSILSRIGQSLEKEGRDYSVLQVACLEVAVRLSSGCDKAWYGLGKCYIEMHQRISSPKMCEEAVLAFRRALELQPVPHPDRSMLLTSLGNALRSLYECNGDIDTLNEGILHHRDALTLRPLPHANRAVSLLSLGNALMAVFERTDNIDALNEGISCIHHTLALWPAPHPDRSTSLISLGAALQALYHRNGDINALNEGISHLRDTPALLPAHHPYRLSSLSNLGNALRTLFEHNGDANALNESILHHRDVLALRPTPHPDRALLLNNLGYSLYTLYEHNEDANALNEGISHLRDALVLHPAPHPNRPSLLNNLATALLSQHRHNGEIGTLNEAIVLRHELLVLRPLGHRYRVYYAERFVEMLVIRFALTGEEADRDEIEVSQRELDEYKSDRSPRGA
ncbi:hypothetical protein EST38_g3829 [Candolleomyces aberdarensis]|uniref:Nephrocystin 3-like N-terminal domain-containing protein n=1 Tax=Candolleomyces aberdarensis TaxID=2316362 RepID=A0A4Q2DT41_9AGAR|nr:hypothetical protein EST38_g3829 [Candolleomyces aberdarensis]